MQARADEGGTDDAAVLAITTLGADHDVDAFATDLLDRGLIACANILPAVRSIYRWEGRMESEIEVLIFMKTMRGKVEALKEVLRNTHPYDVPELLVFDASDGLEAYLTWVRFETRST